MGIQLNEALLLCMSAYVHTVRFQSLKNAGPVRLRRDDNHRIPRLQNGFDTTGKSGHERCIVRIKFDFVPNLHVAWWQVYKRILVCGVLTCRIARFMTNQASADKPLALKN